MDKDTLIKVIRETLRLKLMSIRVKSTNTVKEASEMWEVILA